MTSRNVNPNLRKNIVRLRKNAGFRSALKFSEAVEIPHSTIRDIEAGYSNGTFDTKKKIADFFGLTEADLLADPDKIDTKSPLDQAILITEAQLKALSEESNKKGAQAVIDAINKPVVESLNSDRALLLKLVDSMSDVEIRKLYPTYKSLFAKLRARNTGKKAKASF